MSDFLKILIIKRLLINKSVVHGSLQGTEGSVVIEDPLRLVVDKICRMYKPIYCLLEPVSPCMTISCADEIDDEFEML
jgi:hypothetical protein